ncbi:MAG: stage III sporulation protein AA [Firmicutes bacterium]|nr:stage III sporulation protein AA [Bacillota bacterium]
MLSSLLPKELWEALHNKNLNSLQELRIRVNAPVVACINNKYIQMPITATNSIIQQILLNASNHSLYTVNDQIISGYITIKGGIRIGVAGEVVADGVSIKTIKNISSLNIRVPHQVSNCCLAVLDKLKIEDSIYSTLIVAPPAAGKTTMLRDLALKISGEVLQLNTLIIDERYELASFYNGTPQLKVGEFCDVLSGAKKSFGFTNAIRSMRPDVVITDELGGREDFDACENAISCGVSVVASIHAGSLEELTSKSYFKKVFSRYVLLSNKQGAGTIEGVFDKCLKPLY